MITWMQRHKKWLVITIWISTIAFVGAGFVGWGSYDYGSKGGVVATVGNKEISVEEYQQEYSNLYNQYSQIFGASFNKELAEQLRLKDVAFSQLLQKNLLMSYGNSLGLMVTDEEIAKELINYEEFKVDGKFNKNQYVNVLQQNRMSPQEFETSLKNSILFQKVQALFSIEPTPNEIENISKLLFLEDDITYKILTLNDVDVNSVDENELKKYFDENQNAYKSEALLSLNHKKLHSYMHFDKFKSDYKFEDGKLKSFEEAKEEIIKDLDENFSKKEALTLYLKLKKSEDNFDKKATYSENKIPFSAENVQKIKELKKEEILKPFFENNRFYIVKLAKINPSVNLTFEQAKAKVIEDFKLNLKAKKLDELAQNSLKDFKGNEATAVNRASASKIKGLNEQEAIEFLAQLFASSTKEGIAKVGSKVVLYKIIDSRMASYDKAKDSFVRDEIKQVQNSDLLSNLLKKLENSIVIKTFMQAKE